MRLMRVRPGTRVISAGEPYTIVSCLDLKSVLCRAENRHKLIVVNIEDLRIDPSQEQAELPDLAAVPDREWQVAQDRLDVIRPFVELGPYEGSRFLVQKAADRANKDIATLYRWIEKYRRDGLAGLLPKTRCDKGRSRLSDEVEEIIEQAISDRYLKEEKETPKDVWMLVRSRCLARNLDVPHVNTIRNRIAALSEQRIVRAQRGQKAAKRFDPVKGKFEPSFPLAVVQIDHTPGDIILVDDEHREPLGRPWITVAIDVWSRVVCGFVVTFDAPSAHTVGLCISNAVLPKDALLAHYDIDGEWPVWGRISVIHADNAKEFRGESLRNSCQIYGMDLEWRPITKPEYGGHIERLLGSVSQEIKKLPGTTFSNTQEKGDYDSVGKAALTLSEFEEWLTTFFVKVYHNRPHSGLEGNLSPLARFEDGIYGTDTMPGKGIPDVVADEERFRIDFLPYTERTVQNDGLTWDGITYYADVLRKWIHARDPSDRKRKRKFICRRDPRDISSVFFYDPESKSHHEIPCRDMSRPSLSLWELRAVKKFMKSQGAKRIDEQAIFDGYERMRAVSDRAVSKRAEQKRQAARFKGTPLPKAKHEPIEVIDLEDIKPFDMDRKR